MKYRVNKLEGDVHVYEVEAKDKEEAAALVNAGEGEYVDEGECDSVVLDVYEHKPDEDEAEEVKP
jgi:hypothetical protein